MRTFIFIFFTLTSSLSIAQQSLLTPSLFQLNTSKEWTISALAQGFAASDAIPISEFESDWQHYTPRSGTNSFVLKNYAQISVSKDSWQLGWVYRQQGFLNTNKDTVDFFHLYKNKKRPQQVQNFNINAKFDSWSASGLHIAKAFSLPALFSNKANDKANEAPTFIINTQFYGKPIVHNAQLNGKIHYQSDDEYSVQANYKESYSNYHFPFMQESTVKGSGMSVSVALALPLNDNLSAYFTVQDMWSRMKWSMLPAVEKWLDSDVKNLDADGYVNYRPLLSGRNSQVNAQQRLGATTNASIRYQKNDWKLQASIDNWQGTTIPAISAQYLSQYGNIGINYESRFHSIGLDYELSTFQFQIRSNKLQTNLANVLGVQANWHYSF